MRGLKFGFLTWLVVLVFPVVAPAQGVAENLSELRLLVRAGDRLKVRDAQGHEARGRLVSISPTTLRLSVGSQPREWQAADLDSIWARRGDSLGNGAYWGLGVGAIIGGLAAGGLSEGHDTAAAAALGALVYGAIGAGIGVGIDAMITGDHVVFARPGRGSVLLRVEPWVTPRVQGAAVRLGF